MINIWPTMMKIEQKMIKIGPKNKQVDFSEGVLAAEGGEQAILKMVVTMGDPSGAIYGVYMAYIWLYMAYIWPIYGYIWPIYGIYMAIYGLYMAYICPIISKIFQNRH